HALGAIEVLDCDRDAVERQRLAAGKPMIRRLGHLQRPLGCRRNIGIERRGRFDRVVIGKRELTRGKLFGCKPIARFGEAQSQEGGILHSTTFGTTKKARAVRGALARISSRRPPSVTSSSRIGKAFAAALAIGGTSDVSTSFSCSTQVRICESWSAKGSSSASASLIRASAAICATAALSSAMISPSPKSAIQTGYHCS